MARLDKRYFNKVKKLYYQDCLSVREVAEHLSVPMNAVFYFMRRYCLKRRTFTEENNRRFLKQRPSFIVKEKLTLHEQLLKIAGIILYWSEGSKWQGERIVDFANGDPIIVKIFLNFLRKICRVKEDKLRGFIYCYDNQNVSKITEFWTSLAEIPKKQFTKPYIRKDYKPEKQGRMPRGLIHIRYNDKKLLIKLREWIEEYGDLLRR